MLKDGLGGDRASLTPRPEDEAVIRAVAKANPRTIVVLAAAGAEPKNSVPNSAQLGPRSGSEQHRPSSAKSSRAATRLTEEARK
jgi:hypothetical protein